MVSSVADPERMDADLDLTFYIDADPHFNLLVTYFLKHLNIRTVFLEILGQANFNLKNVHKTLQA